MDVDVSVPSLRKDQNLSFRIGLLDSGAERASLSRLRIAAAICGGDRVREIRTDQAGLSGWWFGLKLGRWSAKVADAVLSIRNSGEGVAGAIEDFMHESDIDVARFAIVGTDEARSIVDDVAGCTGVWYFLGQREQRDLLNIRAGIDRVLARIGPRARRNLRRSVAEAARIGLTFAFHERSGAIEIDGEVASLAGRGRPLPANCRHLAMLENIFEHRPASFQSMLRAADGTLLSLCRGFIQGRTAYLIYQLNDPAAPKVNIGAFHNLKLIRELAARGIHELILAMPSHQLQPACRVSSNDELITIRPSPRGLAVAAMLVLTLRGTHFSEGVKSVLGAVLRHWFGLPKVAFLKAVRALTPGNRNWEQGVAALLGLLASASAVATATAMREGLGFLPYLTVYPAFLVATYFAGAWIGLLTILLGGLGILYFAVPPYNSFMVAESPDFWAAVIYLTSALIVWRWLARRTRTLGVA